MVVLCTNYIPRFGRSPLLIYRKRNEAEKLHPGKREGELAEERVVHEEGDRELELDDTELGKPEERLKALLSAREKAQIKQDVAFRDELC